MTESGRTVPLRLCVTIVCAAAAVACTFLRIPGNMACALVCMGLAMTLPDVLIELPKTADELLAEALEENRALKALLKSELGSESEPSDTESDSGTESGSGTESDSGTESESSKRAKSV